MNTAITYAGQKSQLLSELIVKHELKRRMLHRTLEIRSNANFAGHVVMLVSLLTRFIDNEIGRLQDVPVEAYPYRMPSFLASVIRLFN